MEGGGQSWGIQLNDNKGMEREKQGVEKKGEKAGEKEEKLKERGRERQ